MKYLVWTDLETTGSDEAKHWPLEVGIILTDPQLNELARFQSLVDPPMYHPPYWPTEPNDFVREMHTKNGLWDEVVGEGLGARHLDTVDRKIVMWLLDQDVLPREGFIAGSGVSHFDRRWIHRFFPLFDAHLHYPAIDVGVMRRMLLMNDIDLGVPKPKDHRVMGDVENAIAQLKSFNRIAKSWRGAGLLNA